MYVLGGLADECLPFALEAFSDLCEFFAFAGILPETYRAAPPRPGFAAGSRFAMTVVDRGIIMVSSSYTESRLAFPSYGTRTSAVTITYLHHCHRMIE